MPAFNPEHLFPELAAFSAARVCWIAYSGGMDSAVLLHALASLCDRFPFDIRALHVDHGLHSSSRAWAEHCRRACERLGVSLEIRRVQVIPAPGESLEAVARVQRYAAMAELLGRRDLLLTAQHRDDQAETLLLALMRGSGPKGLASMPRLASLGDGYLVRPLLGYSRLELLEYAENQGLAWIEDPGNRDLSFDRNFIRHRVLPVLAKRWPASANGIARSASHCAEAQGLIDLFAAEELAKVGGQRAETLSISRLGKLALPLQKVVLRHWFRDLGLPPPDSRHLQRILSEVTTARADANPLVAWRGCEVRRYRDDLFAMALLPPVPGRKSIQWQKGTLSLPSGLGRLELIASEGQLRDPRDFFRNGLSVRFGVEGLSCRRRAGGPNRLLRKLYQEAAVPPWMRNFIPLLFAEGSLIAVGDIWICHTVGTELENGFSIGWTADLPALRPLVPPGD